MQPFTAHFHQSSPAAACPVCLHVPSFQGGCSGFGFILLFLSALAWSWPRLMVDWTRKHLAAFWEEAVKLSAFLPSVHSSQVWQRWTDGWCGRPPQSETSQSHVVNQWRIFKKLLDRFWKEVSLLSVFSLCRSSVPPRLMRFTEAVCLFTLSKQSSKCKAAVAF